jgi:TatD DNase family protein
VTPGIHIFYDTHAHLDYDDFTAELPEVIARADQAGISRIISIGTDLDSSRRAMALAEKFPNVYAAVGWHPCNVLEAPDDLRPALREMAEHPKVVALGETGLDYHRMPGGDELSGAEQNEAYKQKQARVFAQHLEVAIETGLNCVIHQRDSLEDTLRQLSCAPKPVRSVFHCFAENTATLRRILDLGSIVSFTGILTFKNGQNIRDTLAASPMGSFMLETDCPYLAPAPYRGKRCEPAYVKEIAQTAAEVKKVSLEELSEATCRAARDFFHKMK